MSLLLGRLAGAMLAHKRAEFSMSTIDYRLYVYSSRDCPKSSKQPLHHLVLSQTLTHVASNKWRIFHKHTKRKSLGASHPGALAHFVEPFFFHWNSLNNHGCIQSEAVGNCFWWPFVSTCWRLRFPLPSRIFLPSFQTWRMAKVGPENRKPLKLGEQRCG